MKGNDIRFTHELATFYLVSCRITDGDKEAWEPFERWSDQFFAGFRGELNDAWRYHVLRRRLQEETTVPTLCGSLHKPTQRRAGRASRSSSLRSNFPCLRRSPVTE